MDSKSWFIVGGLALAAFIFGRASIKSANNIAQDVEENAEPESVHVIGGQPYYNLNFQMSGNLFNPLAEEYMPLFGFVGSRVAY